MCNMKKINLNKSLGLFCLFVALSASIESSLAFNDEQQMYEGSANRLDAYNSNTLRALDDTKLNAPIGDGMLKKRLGSRFSNEPIVMRSEDGDELAQVEMTGTRQYLANEEENERRQQQQQQQQKKQQRAKWALKKKLHKIVEDMVDDQFSGKPQSVASGPAKQIGFIKPDYDMKRKRWHNSNDEQEKFMILMKKPAGYLDSAVSSQEEEDLQSNGSGSDKVSGGALNLALRNYLSGQPSSTASMARDPTERFTSSQRPLVSSGEHARRVMDDKFGIMRDSIFTTNNHLGLKGVPKFGSDEEY